MTDKQQIAAYLPPGLYDWLRRAAFDARRSQNSIVVQALEELRDRTRSNGDVPAAMG